MQVCVAASCSGVILQRACNAGNSAYPYEAHFGLQPVVLTDTAREAVDRRAWTSQRGKLGKLGGVIEAVPEGVEPSSAAGAKHKVYPLIKRGSVVQVLKWS